MTDEEVQRILAGVSCAGIDKPGSPAWRMKKNWLLARQACQELAGAAMLRQNENDKFEAIAPNAFFRALQMVAGVLKADPRPSPALSPNQSKPQVK